MNALTFLAPAGLLALAALALPLLIHLFSRSRGKRVLVGNIALYRQARRQRVTELRLVQWLLLMLRLGLLALAALLLADLARVGLDRLPGETAYVTPEWWAAADREDRDALGDHDHALLLAPGFAPVSAAADAGTHTQSDPDFDSDPEPDPAGPAAPPAPDTWSLLAERLDTVRHDGPVHLYALSGPEQFPARAPALGHPITWHLVPPSDTSAPLAPPALTVRLVAAPGRRQDAMRLQAALETAAAHRTLNLSLQRHDAGEAPGDTPADVLLWLGDGDGAIGDAVRGTKDFHTLLEDRPAQRGEPVPVELPTWPRLRYLARPGPSEPGTVLWRDQAGRPLLLERRSPDQRRLVFLEHLGATPGGLTTRAGFPDALLRLLLDEAQWMRGLALAPADPRPATTRAAPAVPAPGRPLAPWLALAMALLFGLERWLSERPARQTAP